MSLINPSPENIKAARVAAQLTQPSAAQRFGYSLSGWKQKELMGKNSRALSQGEFELLLLLAGQHPDYELINKQK